MVAVADCLAAPGNRLMPGALPSCSAGGQGGQAALAAAGAVGMAAALDEGVDLKEQARADALAARTAQRREAKEWLDEAVPRLVGK